MSTATDAESGRPAARRSPAKKAPARKAAPRPAPAAADVLEGEAELPNAFNLDELEREGKTAEPFAFVHKGRQYVLTDPQDHDWQRLLLVLNNPIQFLRLVIRESDRDAFFETPMPAWKLRALTEAYQKHFGLGALGESGGFSV